MIHSRLFAIALAGSIAAASVTPVCARLQNGGFELPSLQEGVYQNLSGNQLPSWTITTWDVNVLNLPVDSFIGYEAFEGQQVLANGSGHGTIIQDFATTPGREYRLRLAYADTPYASGEKFGIVQIENPIADDLVLSTSITHSTSTDTFADWTLFNSKFRANGSVMRLRLILHPWYLGGLVFDAVSVTEIPEPSGVCLLGPIVALSLSRRSRNS
jgi:hypothetical protein